MIDIKMIILGEPFVGKTTLLQTYAPKDWVQLSGFVSLRLMYENTPVNLYIRDISRSECIRWIFEDEMPNPDAILLCFALDWPDSLKKIEYYYRTVQKYCPKTPYILVGTKSELRDELIQNNEEKTHSDSSPITTFEGEQMKRRINAHDYIECSSFQYLNVYEVFNLAIKAVIDHQKSIGTQNNENLCCSIS